jgi:hypothetical protein
MPSLGRYPGKTYEVFGREGQPPRKTDESPNEHRTHHPVAAGRPRRCRGRPAVSGLAAKQQSSRAAKQPTRGCCRRPTEALPRETCGGRAHTILLRLASLRQETRRHGRMEHGGAMTRPSPLSTAASGLRSGATVSASGRTPPCCRRPNEAQPRETCGWRAPPGRLPCSMLHPDDERDPGIDG